MAILNIETGAAAKAIHVQQIINWLRGIPGFSEPVSFTGISSASAYALNVANTESVTGLGLGLRVWNSAISVPLLLVNHAGVTIRPNSNSQSYNFSVRNFANDTDLFKVTEAGVTFSGAGLVTTTNTVILTNKTLTAPTINSGILNAAFINDYLNFNITNAPSTPGTTQAFLYAKITTNDFRFKIANSGTEHILIDDASAQTISNKTLNATTFNAPTFSGAIISNYEDYVQSGATPGNPGAGKARLWMKTDNNAYINVGGIDQTILTSANTSLSSSASYARSLMLGSL